MKTILTKTQTNFLKQTNFLNQYTEGSWELNPKTGLVNIDGDFDCAHKGLRDFKEAKAI